jgi:hypothetical protein
MTGEIGQMRIDVDALTEPELIDLNNRIIARLRFSPRSEPTRG